MNEVEMKVLDTFDEEHPMNEFATLFRSSESGAMVMVDHYKGVIMLVDQKSMQIAKSDNRKVDDDE